MIEIFKNHRLLLKIKEKMVRFVLRILNEENGMSHNFTRYILIGQGFQVDSTKKDGDTAKESDTNAESGKEQMQVNPKHNHYRYQVGYGNNHFLIKSVIKQRWWCHMIT